MFELTIKDTVYQFHFGMGFLREINKTVKQAVDGVPEAKKNIGLRFKIAGIMDGDLEDLVDVLDVANKGQNPRITRNALDAYIDDPETDIDALFASVLDFFGTANVTKKTMKEIQEAIEANRAKMAKN